MADNCCSIIVVVAELVAAASAAATVELELLSRLTEGAEVSK